MFSCTKSVSSFHKRTHLFVALSGSLTYCRVIVKLLLLTVRKVSRHKPQSPPSLLKLATKWRLTSVLVVLLMGGKQRYCDQRSFPRMLR